MSIKYFSSGSESEAEGLTVHKELVDDDTGESIIKFVGMYKEKEITEEQYNAYLARFNDPSSLKGMIGLVNETGYRKAQEMRAKMDADNLALRIQENEAQIALSVKKIRKLLQLEIIEQSDVDVEIEQQGMSQFKDEIKRRLEQN